MTRVMTEVGPAGIDDGYGKVNGVAQLPDGKIVSTQFYASILERRVRIIPGVERPYRLLEYEDPVQFNGTGVPIFANVPITVGDGAFHAGASLDLSEGRYLSAHARIRIRCALAQLYDEEFGADPQGRELGYRVPLLVIGANLRDFRRISEELQALMTGLHVFKIGKTVYSIQIDKVLAVAQPYAAMRYIQSQLNPTWKNWLIIDIGTGTTDIIPIMRGLMDEELADAFPVGVESLRRELRQMLETQFPSTRFTVPMLEGFLVDAEPTLPSGGVEVPLLPHVELARTRAWKELLRQAAETLRGVSVSAAYFVGGGALAFEPTIRRQYAQQRDTFQIVADPAQAVARGYYLLAAEASPPLPKSGPRNNGKSTKVTTLTR